MTFKNLHKFVTFKKSTIFFTLYRSNRYFHNSSSLRIRDKYFYIPDKETIKKRSTLDKSPKTNHDENFLEAFAYDEPESGVDGYDPASELEENTDNDEEEDEDEDERNRSNRDPNLDLTDAHIPFLTEETRQEIWKKYQEDPSLWTFEKISQHYGTSMERTKAIIYFMRSRDETKMEELGTIEIPKQWEEIFEKFNLDPTVNTETVLAETFQLSESEIKIILKKMKIHTERLNHLKDFNEDMNDFIEYAADHDASPGFKEVPGGELIKLSNDYFPQMFNDEGLKRAKKLLLDRIEKETKAKVDITPDHFFHDNNKNIINDIKQQKENILANKTEIREHMEETLKSRLDIFEKFSRFKFAFKDLSTQSVSENKPTMIRTRSGLWRVATPFEEFNQSWRQKPPGIEMALHGHIFDKFKDPDGDEEEAKLIPKLRRERHKELKQQLALAAASAPPAVVKTPVAPVKTKTSTKKASASTGKNKKK